MIQVKTSRFGDIEVQEGDVIELPHGLIGFPELKKYVLLDHDKDSPFKWLQSLDDGAIAGCALDVGRDPDQMPALALARHPNVIATPHIAGLTPADTGGFIDGIAFDAYGNLWGHARDVGPHLRHHAGGRSADHPGR